MSWNSHDIWLNDERLSLTDTEYRLFTYMFDNRHRLCRKSELNIKILGYNKNIKSRSLDTHISNLRAKLAIRKRLGDVIITIHGLGYKIVMVSEVRTKR